ncbi:Telomerase reverse transcriptase, partial [Coemansia helicoidea]
LASITIPRGRMLFSAPRLWGDLDWTLPPSFPLNRHTSGHLLAQHIFKRVPHFAAAPPAALLALTSRMLKLHKKFNYRHHLFRLCPAPWQQPQHGQQAPGDAQAPGPLDQASPHTAVFGFLQHCVRSVVPRDLVGGKRNHRRLYAALRTVVSAGRFEALSLHEVMQRFRLCEATKWLDTSAASAMDIYASMICWVLSEYTVRIVRKYFYVTESSQSRRHLYYFRSDVWRSLAREAWGQLKNSGIYAPKPESAAAAAAAAATDGHLAFGHSRMRLLPKEQGFRPIVNMRRSYMLRPVAPGAGSGTRLRLGERPAASTNKSLADILAALRPWQRGRPELFGTATFGPDDLHARLAAFKRSIGTAGGLGAVPLYMAKLDISRAYDTIPQTLLLSQLRACLPDGELAVQKYWTLSPSFSRPRPAFLRHGQRASDTAEFHDLARALAARHKGLVVGDQSATTYVHTDSIFARVSEHVQQTTVRAHGRLLRQARGIPQGSVLSSLLCNFFYGQLEAAHVAPILDPRTTLVMRVVDDILAVSTAEVQLVAVVECISRAFGERGSTLNPAKTLANFALAVGGQPARRTSGPGFPWCGMLIDDRSLDVMVDYSRMGPPLRVSSFLTVNPGREGGQLLRQKLLAAVRIKIHPLYMSCGFNSRGTVLLNLYQNFVICAKKLHAICQRLHACSLNQPFLASVIEDTLALAYILLRSRCRERSIAPDVVRWLGGHAFHAVLQRKKARYAVLLERLAPMRHAPPPAAATDAWVVQRRHNGAALDVIY